VDVSQKLHVSPELNSWSFVIGSIVYGQTDFPNNPNQMSHFLFIDGFFLFIKSSVNDLREL